MNYTLSVFLKACLWSLAASGDTLQTDDRNEPDKADTILCGRENKADAIVTLPGTWGSMRCH